MADIVVSVFVRLKNKAKEIKWNHIYGALKRTLVNRRHTFIMEQFEQVMTFDNNDSVQKNWKSFWQKIDTKTNDFSTVLKTIKEFLLKPFIEAVEGNEHAEQVCR